MQTLKDRNGVVVWGAVKHSTEVRRPCLQYKSHEISSTLEGRLSHMLLYFYFAGHFILQVSVKEPQQNFTTLNIILQHTVEVFHEFDSDTIALTLAHSTDTLNTGSYLLSSVENLLLVMYNKGKYRTCFKLWFTDFSATDYEDTVSAWGSV